MRCRWLVLSLCLTILCSGGDFGGWSGFSTPALAQETPAWGAEEGYQGDVADVQVFYEPLAPYGRWLTLPEYGEVWMPHGVPAGWRPYMEGRWVYTRHGWTWVAEQPWGWAPFHYGRWAFVTSYGWVWSPGTVWGPAWVVWHHTPGWVGWSPLPPHVVWRPGIGLSGTYVEHRLDPAWFCFVEERRFVAPRVVTYIAPPTRNVVLLPHSRNVTNYTVVHHRIVNNSLPVERIERVTARPVPRVRIVPTPTPEGGTGLRVRDKAREVRFYHPGAPQPQGKGAVPGGQTSLPRPAPNPGLPGPGSLSVPSRPPTSAPGQRWPERVVPGQAIRPPQAPQVVSPPGGVMPEELRRCQEAAQQEQRRRRREVEQQAWEHQYRRERQRHDQGTSPPLPKAFPPGAPQAGPVPPPSGVPHSRPPSWGVPGALSPPRTDVPQAGPSSSTPTGGPPGPRPMPPHETPRPRPPHTVTPPGGPQTPATPPQSAPFHAPPTSQAPHRRPSEETKDPRKRPPPPGLQPPQPGVPAPQ